MQRKASFCTCTEEFCRCLLVILPTSLLPCTDIVPHSHGARKPGRIQPKGSWLLLHQITVTVLAQSGSPLFPQAVPVVGYLSTAHCRGSSLHAAGSTQGSFAYCFVCHMRRIKQEKRIRFFFIFNMWSKFESLCKITFKTEEMQASFVTWQPYILSKWPQHC